MTARPLEPYRPPNLVIGVTLLVVAEMMFFAGLISAYLVARAHTDGWPPIGQPRLPIQNTAFNTLILLLSAYTIKLCLREQSRFRLLETCVLGLTFVLLQGREWLALLGSQRRACVLPQLRAQHPPRSNRRVFCILPVVVSQQHTTQPPPPPILGNGPVWPPLPLGLKKWDEGGPSNGRV